MELQALLFGPGQAAAGSPVAARFDAAQLSCATAQGAPLSSAYAALAVARCGFNDAHLSLSWRQAGESWSLVIADAAAVQRLLAAPPPGLAPALAAVRRQTRRDGRRRALGWSALGLWLAAPLLLLGVLLLNAGPLVAWATGLVSVEREQKLGAELFKAQKARLQLVTGTVANDAVETIGRRLTQGSAYTYHWHVARDPSINAFAMPGGYIVVHTGLIAAAASPEELAGVIAHEVQHVERRHSLQQMARGLGVSAALALVFGDLGTLGGIAGQLSELKFSRDHEREADRHGLEALLAAGINPEGMVAMFRKLEEAAAGMNPPAMLSSHPATTERIEAIQQAVRAAAPQDWKPLEVDWAAGQRSVQAADAP